MITYSFPKGAVNVDISRARMAGSGELWADIWVSWLFSDKTHGNALLSYLITGGEKEQKL